MGSTRDWRIGAAILAVVALALLALPWLAPTNPYDLAALDIADARLPPGTHAAHASMIYWLGTDEQGRDMLSAILYGVRTSLVVGTLGSGGAFAIGGLLGLCAAWFGRRVDSLIMRIADLQLSFPSILVALMLLALIGPGMEKIVVALITAQWAYFARAMRAVALVEKRKEYIAAASLLGFGDARVLMRHLLPNCLPTLFVLLPLQLASAVTLEATLSFLGLGAPITHPTLGLLIANGFQYLMSGRYWISLFPGIALVLVILAINLMADRLTGGTSRRQTADLRSYI